MVSQGVGVTDVLEAGERPVTLQSGFLERDSWILYHLATLISGYIQVAS